MQKTSFAVQLKILKQKKNNSSSFSENADQKKVTTAAEAAAVKTSVPTETRKKKNKSSLPLVDNAKNLNTNVTSLPLRIFMYVRHDSMLTKDERIHDDKGRTYGEMFYAKIEAQLVDWPHSDMEYGSATNVSIRMGKKTRFRDATSTFSNLLALTQYVSTKFDIDLSQYIDETHPNKRPVLSLWMYENNKKGNAPVLAYKCLGVHPKIFYKLSAEQKSWFRKNVNTKPDINTTPHIKDLTSSLFSSSSEGCTSFAINKEEEGEGGERINVGKKKRLNRTKKNGNAKLSISKMDDAAFRMFRMYYTTHIRRQVQLLDEVGENDSFGEYEKQMLQKMNRDNMEEIFEQIRQKKKEYGSDSEEDDGGDGQKNGKRKSKKAFADMGSGDRYHFINIIRTMDRNKYESMIKSAWFKLPENRSMLMNPPSIRKAKDEEEEEEENPTMEDFFDEFNNSNNGDDYMAQQDRDYCMLLQGDIPYMWSKNYFRKIVRARKIPELKKISISDQAVADNIFKNNPKRHETTKAIYHTPSLIFNGHDIDDEEDDFLCDNGSGDSSSDSENGDNIRGPVYIPFEQRMDVSAFVDPVNDVGIDFWDKEMLETWFSRDMREKNDDPFLVNITKMRRYGRLAMFEFCCVFAKPQKPNDVSKPIWIAYKYLLGNEDYLKKLTNRFDVNRAMHMFENDKAEEEYGSGNDMDQLEKGTLSDEDEYQRQRRDEMEKADRFSEYTMQQVSSTVRRAKNIEEKKMQEYIILQERLKMAMI